MYYNIFKRLFALVLVSVSPFYVRASTHMLLKRAMQTKAVTLKAISNGGIWGKSIKLDIQNNTTRDLAIDVDPGLIFLPEDTILQNLVLLGNETVALAPSAHVQVDLPAFCGKKYGHCPRPNVKYNFWKQGDSNMIKTLSYAKNISVNAGLIQRAVWTFTNGECLNTVYLSHLPNESERMIKYIASLRRVSIPDYYTEFSIDNVPGRAVAVAGSERSFVNVHWGTEGYKHMYLTIYKENGDVYKQIEADQVIDKNGYTVAVEFDPKRDLPGTYFIRLHDESGRVWEQKRVIVGVRPCDIP